MATKSIRLSDGTDTFLPESAESDSGYCKFADGTLICFGEETFQTTANAVTQQAVTFPKAFVSSPKMFALGVTGSPQTFRTGVHNIPTTTGGIVNVSSAYSSAARITVYWLAIGRWK